MIHIKPATVFLDEGHLVLVDLGLCENIQVATFEVDEAVTVQLPVWLGARTEGGDNFRSLWVDGHNSTKISRPP